jgi:hypothetical protein
MAVVGMSSRICAKSLKLLGAGEALRLKIFSQFFLVKPSIYVSKLNFVLDALLDVSLDTRPPLNSARVPFRTRFRLYGNP